MKPEARSTHIVIFGIFPPDPEVSGSMTGLDSIFWNRNQFSITGGQGWYETHAVYHKFRVIKSLRCSTSLCTNPVQTSSLEPRKINNNIFQTTKIDSTMSCRWHRNIHAFLDFFQCPRYDNAVSTRKSCLHYSLTHLTYQWLMISFGRTQSHANCGAMSCLVINKYNLGNCLHFSDRLENPSIVQFSISILLYL